MRHRQSGRAPGRRRADRRRPQVRRGPCGPTITGAELPPTTTSVGRRDGGPPLAAAEAALAWPIHEGEDRGTPAFSTTGRFFRGQRRAAVRRADKHADSGTISILHEPATTTHLGVPVTTVGRQGPLQGSAHAPIGWNAVVSRALPLHRALARRLRPISAPPPPHAAMGGVRRPFLTRGPAEARRHGLACSPTSRFRACKEPRPPWAAGGIFRAGFRQTPSGICATPPARDDPARFRARGVGPRDRGRGRRGGGPWSVVYRDNRGDRPRRGCKEVEALRKRPPPGRTGPITPGAAPRSALGRDAQTQDIFPRDGSPTAAAWARPATWTRSGRTAGMGAPPGGRGARRARAGHGILARAGPACSRCSAAAA